MNLAEQKIVQETVVKMTVDALGITEQAARLRVNAMMRSGILNRFESPDDTLFQFVVDQAMRIPQIGDESSEDKNG